MSESKTIAPVKDADAEQGKARAGLNKQIARRQNMLLAGIGSLALIAGAWFLFAGDGDEKGTQESGIMTIDAGSLVNRNLSQREFVAAYENRLNKLTQDQKALKEAQLPTREIEEQIEALRLENSEMRTNGQAAIDAISTENAGLKSQLKEKAAAPAPVPPAYGPQSGDFNPQSASLGSPDGTEISPGGSPSGAVKILNFGSTEQGSKSAKKRTSETSPLLVEDSPEYLPPNSYAPAKVIVGVDASVGVASQSDPLPVVLRITGPARSVVKNGKLLTTNITGCIVNGAARGDLSAEKVYVKLARMTCNQPGGRVAVSEVKGFISFAGKSGVRGRVVSREGSLVSQALLAGIVGGFGRGFSANANGIFSGQIGADGKRDSLSGADILTGGLGQGAGDAADTVSKYLIERAEQYQPVVEMPTGIDVEIVFLDGVHVRREKK
ncbi:TrbI/VirB10 family protein [Sphingorhabdus sp. YGSMI21]|jgi:conjugal transfer pilus assembly protein TraB|uniref:TrbI/VirB10 family protein n=1 Tax=Sphingorhabdus sp. YGSMI21 TaxID=2077182 RepID=UPI000C1E9263|nr:TrbI/VirB10 family protein [Sphingorhabdus sp. YGSMI21]ATW02170.1 conjugal transfer protein TraB [Sphingorhabdus sp. YGSMI21]